MPDLVSTADLHVVLPDLVNLRQQGCILFGPRTTQLRCTLLGGMATVTRRGDLQQFADRLDPIGIAMLVNDPISI